MLLRRGWILLTIGTLLLGVPGRAEAEPELLGEGPRLREVGISITQEAIERGELPLREIRRQGRLVFSTPFRKADGYGDGPVDPDDPTSPGARPTLQGNGTFLRVNGLDGQSCLECHSIVSNAVVPARFGVGGVGGAVSNAMFQPTMIDVSDEAGAGFTSFDGRFINPPFLFGAGGVQLLALEMTEELQELKQRARARPGKWISLMTKGIDFGAIRYSEGVFDTTRIEGIDEDLVVRPFGRKGEFPSIRAFDLEALAFHFGMQAVELVGPGIDGDLDGVVDEVRVGEVSALEIFAATLERPREERLDRETRRGRGLFEDVGCADCHRPQLVTASRSLPLRFPEIARDPAVNVYYSVDLSDAPTGFYPARRAGVVVPLFADLKRHDMGAALAESFGSDLDRFFTTARLWGVADTAPYMHDGRATTLREAILMHGGEAEDARDAFASLEVADQGRLLAFLLTLRTPEDPTTDLD
ncbi:MAG: hypothetical protein JRF61_04975 [Deltaproteobacteria bacterium]|jgi:hypothetical protein|nr:hypothetical protein [Deltaproteobacteria bacterium]